MFTIKWIVRTPLGDVTRMYEAREIAVAYRNDIQISRPVDSTATAPHSQPPRWEVADRPVDNALLIMDPYEPNYAGRSFACGTVYVMNETGATVGKYVLNDSVVENPQPLVIPVETSGL